MLTSKGAGMGMGPPTPCGGPFPPCPIPLDGGVSLLLIAGAAYGGKKIYDSVKRNP
ncbi:MAG: PID-CTERM protein-sorting domain-containing protein [Bacteroidota bacterium]